MECGAGARNEESPQSEEALATLCQTYWYPLYAFVRRQGHSPADAQDLTQEFFARLIEKRFLARIQREGGRFRSFLLTALKRFLANEWDRARAQKRGGGQTVISIDTDSAETRYRLEPFHEVTPERIYERHWAQTLLGQVLAHLQAEYVAAGKGGLFEGIQSSLSQPRGAVPYAEIASQLGSTEAAIKMAVQRLRARYRELLRAEIAQTVAEPSEVEDESAISLRRSAGKPTREQHIDHRADIYSLGVVFYEMLTGELPLGRFAAPSQKVQVDVRLDEVVLRALEKERDRRYQHASDVKTDVETIASQPARQAQPPAPSLAAATPPPDRARRWFFVTATVCLIGFCLLVLLAICGLLTSIALPAFVRGREHARALAQEQAQRANALAAPAETGLAGRKTTVLKSFGVQDPTLSQNLVVTNNAWFIDSATNQVVRLFEVPNPGMEQGRLIYSAQLKTEGLQGRAYLEMWCRFGKGEFFSRGLNDTVSGSVDWTTHETPFFLRPGEKPDLVKLNVVVEGAGRVWIRDVRLLNGP